MGQAAGAERDKGRLITELRQLRRSMSETGRAGYSPITQSASEGKLGITDGDISRWLGTSANRLPREWEKLWNLVQLWSEDAGLEKPDRDHWRALWDEQQRIRPSGKPGRPEKDWSQVLASAPVLTPDSAVGDSGQDDVDGEAEEDLEADAPDADGASQADADPDAAAGLTESGSAGATPPEPVPPIEYAKGLPHRGDAAVLGAAADGAGQRTPEGTGAPEGVGHLPPESSPPAGTPPMDPDVPAPATPNQAPAAPPAATTHAPATGPTVAAASASPARVEPPDSARGHQHRVRSGRLLLVAVVCLLAIAIVATLAFTGTLFPGGGRTQPSAEPGTPASGQVPPSSTSGPSSSTTTATATTVTATATASQPTPTQTPSPVPAQPQPTGYASAPPGVRAIDPAIDRMVTIHEYCGATEVYVHWHYSVTPDHKTRVQRHVDYAINNASPGQTNIVTIAMSLDGEPIDINGPSQPGATIVLPNVANKTGGDVWLWDNGVPTSRQATLVVSATRPGDTAPFCTATHP